MVKLRPCMLADCLYGIREGTPLSDDSPRFWPVQLEDGVSSDKMRKAKM